jgi:hypothetical protein
MIDARGLPHGVDREGDAVGDAPTLNDSLTPFAVEREAHRDNRLHCVALGPSTSSLSDLVGREEFVEDGHR